MELNKIEELELANLVSTQDADKYRRECLSHRETVTRLEADRSTLREREGKDQEIIKRLLEEIEKQQREFTEKTRELIGKHRDAVCEAHYWKSKSEDLEAKALSLCIENRRLEEKLSRKLADEEMRKRAAEETVVKAKEQEILREGKLANGCVVITLKQKAGNAISNGKVNWSVADKGGDYDSDAEEDEVCLSQLHKKRPREDEEKDSGSFGCFKLPPKKCCASKQLAEQPAVKQGLSTDNTKRVCKLIPYPLCSHLILFIRLECILTAFGHEDK